MFFVWSMLKPINLLSEAIQRVGSVSEGSKIYSSHSFMTHEPSLKDLLRKSSKQETRLEELFDALKLSVSKKSSAQGTKKKSTLASKQTEKKSTPEKTKQRRPSRSNKKRK